MKREALPEAPAGGYFETVDEVDGDGKWVSVVKWRRGARLAVYGRSPALEVLEDMKAVQKLPPEERAFAAARFVGRRLGCTDD